MTETEQVWYCADVPGKKPGDIVTRYEYGN
jgi:hypothetical protein